MPVWTRKTRRTRSSSRWSSTPGVMAFASTASWPVASPDCRGRGCKRSWPRGECGGPSTGEVIWRPAQRLRAGEALIVERPAPREPPVVLDYTELHRDAELLVLDKPAGLPVHPSARYHRHTLTAVLRERLGAGHGWEMAHRLDRETSGVMVFGRHGGSASALKRAFFARDREALLGAVSWMYQRTCPYRHVPRTSSRLGGPDQDGPARWRTRAGCGR
jgi:hypothetical protein